MIDRRRSAPLQLENAKKLESGQVREVRASQAMVPQILVAILCVMSPVSRLPMPDIAFRSACFDTSTACFAE